MDEEKDKMGKKVGGGRRGESAFIDCLAGDMKLFVPRCIDLDCGSGSGSGAGSGAGIGSGRDAGSGAGSGVGSGAGRGAGSGAGSGARCFGGVIVRGKVVVVAMMLIAVVVAVVAVVVVMVRREGPCGASGGE